VSRVNKLKKFKTYFSLSSASFLHHLLSLKISLSESRSLDLRSASENFSPMVYEILLSSQKIQIPIEINETGSL
jgi:hypothetical protein